MRLTLPQTPDPLPSTAYIVAGGPSLTGFKWDLMINLFTVGINRAYEVLPSANIVYFTDEDYYERHIADMLTHSGRLIKGCTNMKKVYDPHVERVHIKPGKGISQVPGTIYHGRNSTFAALNLLVQWGIKRIYLLGVDMQWDSGKSHWHNGHERIDEAGAYSGFMLAYKEAKPMLDSLGVTVINVNNNTAMKVFPVLPLETVFGPECFF